MGFDKCMHLCSNNYHQDVNMSVISEWFLVFLSGQSTHLGPRQPLICFSNCRLDLSSRVSVKWNNKVSDTLLLRFYSAYCF